MLDQSFSAENFRKIFDLENRKGVYLEGQFFPDIAQKTKQIQDTVVQLRALQKKKLVLKPEDYLKKKTKLSGKHKKLKEEKEALLIHELEEISREVTAGTYQIELEPISVSGGKPAYCIDKSPHAYFIMKQLQYNINKLYKVKQANRFQILCQLQSLLGDGFPKYLIRTDIESFYESIPTKPLLRKIDSEALLSQTSKKFVRQIITAYQTLSGNDSGLPRGVGISAYLAELYTRSLDSTIRNQSNVVYYARYVDDIVIVLSSVEKLFGLKELKTIEKIAMRYDLSLNPSKTSFLALPNITQQTIEYLGFIIEPNDTGTKFAFTNRKFRKYNLKIVAVFDDYKRRSKTNEKKARKLLVKRIRFLTGNTRLFNNKRDALVGIFFSNRLLSDTTSLDILDRHLRFRIDALDSPIVSARLRHMSFQKGYEQRRFAHFSPDDFSNIVRIWNYEA